MRKALNVKRPNSMSVKLLLSYLSILALPLVAIVVIYSTASGLMYALQRERINSQLKATAAETQQHLDEAANLSAYISRMPEFSSLQRALQTSGAKATYYQMYELNSKFPDYTLFNSAIRDVYFFFNNQEYIIRLPVVVPANSRSYETIDGVLAEGYENMKTLVSSVYRDRQVVALGSQDDFNRQLGVLQSFPYGAYEKPLGTMLILLNDRYLSEKLHENLVDNTGICFMTDRNGYIVKSFSGASGAPDIQQLDLNMLRGGDSLTLNIEGEEYAVSVARSGSQDYSFFSLVPKSVILRRIGYIKPVIAVLGALSVLVGILVCLGLWGRRRQVVLRYSSYADEMGTAGGGKGVNMWDGIHAVLDSVSELQSTVELQRGFLRSGMVRKLLEGGYTDKLALEEDLSAAGISFAGSLYCVAAVTFNRGFRNYDDESLNKFRLKMIKLVEENLAVPHYCCEPEDMVIAIIIPLAKFSGRDIAREELNALEDSFVATEQMEAFIGLGECVSDTLDIRNSYRQARSVCEYLRFYNFRVVMGYSEMPQSGKEFYFPLEMELNFIRAIEQGNKADLLELFGQLAEENFAERQLTYETQKQLLEMVRCTAIRSLRSGEQGKRTAKSEKEFIERLNKADNLEGIVVLLEEYMPMAAEQSKEALGGKAEQRREEIKSLLESCYGREEITIGEVAEKLSTSESKFYKEFRLLFGVTFSEYLENMRIMKACELLKSQMMIKDISKLVGYSSDYSFRRAFKRVMGITPSAYMENLKS